MAHEGTRNYFACGGLASLRPFGLCTLEEVAVACLGDWVIVGRKGGTAVIINTEQDENRNGRNFKPFDSRDIPGACHTVKKMIQSCLPRIMPPRLHP